MKNHFVQPTPKKDLRAQKKIGTFKEKSSFVSAGDILFYVLYIGPITIFIIGIVLDVLTQKKYIFLSCIREILFLNFSVFLLTLFAYPSLKYTFNITSASVALHILTSALAAIKVSIDHDSCPYGFPDV